MSDDPRSQPDPPVPSSWIHQLRQWLYAPGKAQATGRETAAIEPVQAVLGDDPRKPRFVMGDVNVTDVRDSTGVIVGSDNVQVIINGRSVTVPFWLLALAVLVIAGLLAWPRIEPLYNPSQMYGVTNIAIAQFGELDESGRVRRSELGDSLSRIVYDKLMSEYDLHYPELVGDDQDVLIWHDSLGKEVKNVTFGVITGNTPEKRSEQAGRLAARINADIIIYGNLERHGDEHSLELEFYFQGEAKRGEPDFTTGRHLLGAPLAYPAALEKEPMAVRVLLNDPLSQRSRALLYISAALTYEVIGRQEESLAVLRAALQRLADWDDASGQAILQYFVGRAAYWLRDYDTALSALNEAAHLKPDLAIAYIGLGAVHYDRAQLFYTPQPVPDDLAQCVYAEHLERAAQTVDEVKDETGRAIGYLQHAVEISPDAPWPPVEAVARLMLGNAYRLQGQIYLLEGEARRAGSWFDLALYELQAAAAAFTDPKQPQYLAWTYLSMGGTDYLRGHTRLAEIPAGEPPTAHADTVHQAISFFRAADQELQHCLDEGKDVPDLVFQKEVVDCGCVYYQKVVRDDQAQSENAIKEQ